MLRQIALGDGRNDAGHLGGWPGQVVDQGVDGTEAVGPRPLDAIIVEPFGESSFTADEAADAYEVAGLVLLLGNDVVECVDHGGAPVVAPRDAHLEVAGPYAM